MADVTNPRSSSRWDLSVLGVRERKRATRELHPNTAGPALAGQAAMVFSWHTPENLYSEVALLVLAILVRELAD